MSDRTYSTDLYGPAGEVFVASASLAPAAPRDAPGSEHAQSTLSQIAKRGFDIGVAGAMLMLLSPLFLVVAIMIRQDGPRILFGHERIGRGGRTFKCMKFRTMVNNADQALRDLLARDANAAAEWNATQKLRADPRITPIGKFLRASSLDELPQLLNIIRGEMSLVGPRPIVESEIVRYGDAIGYYLAARPGLTGAWQISGRSDVSYTKRVALDTHYVTTWSFWTDVTILFKTIPAVALRRGAV